MKKIVTTTRQKVYNSPVNNLDRRTTAMNDKEFISNVTREMREFVNHAVTSNGDQFAVWFGKTFLGLDEGEVVNKFHIGSSGDERTDLGIVDEAFPTKMLIQCKHCLNPLNKTFGKNEVDEILDAKNRIKTSPNSGNDRRKQFVQDYISSNLPEKLIVVGFGNFTNADNNNAYDYARKNNVELYDFQKLKLEYTRIIDPASQKRPEDIVIPKLEDKYFICLHDSKKIVFTMIPAIEIYKQVTDKGDGIFDENLRSQLPKALVSSLIFGEIKKTLNNKDPFEFSILNNGVTIIADAIVNNNPNYFQLIKPQIINGCQTSYAIYNFYETLEKSGLNIVDYISYVPLKIIETDTSNTTRNEEIARAANTQNPITPRDKNSTDELQTTLRSTFGNLTPKIFYDNKNGLWDSILRNNKQSIYKVPNIRGKTYRTLNNQLVGQLYLSLLGKPNIAGNQKGIVFSDEKYYSAVFNYKLPSETRFSNIGIELKDAKLISSENDFISDVLFAFGVYRFLEAIEGVLYPKKKNQYIDNPLDPNYEFYEKVATKEFVKFWHFHIVRLIHMIIYTIAQGKHDQIANIRNNLIGSDNNLFFAPNKNIANKFNIEQLPQKYTILDVSNPSVEFALFGKWISSLEQIFYDAISVEKGKLDWKGYNQYFYKRENTLNELWKKITDILGGIDADIKFPH